jgi:ketosteroid isomerase-like protein
VSQENVEIVNRVALGWSDDDELDRALVHVAADAELDWSASEGPDSGVYRGPEGWREWLNGRREGLADARFDVTEVIDVPPDSVVLVARMSGRGRASGAEVEALGAAVWTVRDGQVRRVTMYQTRAQALAAVGLAE